MTQCLSRITAITILFIGITTNILPAETGPASNIPDRLIARKLKKHAPSLAMSVEAVLYKIRQNQKVSLVDVCSREDFERLHIPGSVNIVLHAVKTKNYLKLTPVVLVNEGFRYAELENERRRLLERGFQVSVLDGGLSAWYRKGGKLVGDLFALDAMKSVSPRVFFREKGYKNTLAVDISPTRSEASSRLVPYAQHINALGDKDDLAEEIKTLLHKNKTGPFRSIIIFNENGRQLQTLRRET